MSLLLLEGFDAGNEEALLNRIYSSKTSETSITASGRNGNGCNWGWGGLCDYLFPSADAHATYIVGVAHQIGSSRLDRLIGVYGDDGSTEHVQVRITTTKKLAVYRGNGSILLGETDADVLKANVWHYVELFVTLSDTVGVVKLRVDGKVPPGWTDLANVDTKNGGTAAVLNYVKLHGSGSPGGGIIDDVYIANGAGTHSNGLMGDTRVVTLFPNGNGDTSDFTGSDADSTDNYLLVNETGDPGADYIEAEPDGSIDLFTFEDLPVATGTILGVQLGMMGLKSDSGTKSIRGKVKRSGVVSSGDDKTLQTVEALHDNVFTLDPTASAEWTITNVNGSQFGIEARP